MTAEYNHIISSTQKEYAGKCLLFRETDKPLQILDTHVTLHADGGVETFFLEHWEVGQVLGGN